MPKWRTVSFCHCAKVTHRVDLMTVSFCHCLLLLILTSLEMLFFLYTKTISHSSKIRSSVFNKIEYFNFAKILKKQVKFFFFKANLTIFTPVEFPLKHCKLLNHVKLTWKISKFNFFFTGRATSCLGSGGSRTTGVEGWTGNTREGRTAWWYGTMERAWPTSSAMGANRCLGIE